MFTRKQFIAAFALAVVFTFGPESFRDSVGRTAYNVVYRSTGAVVGCGVGIVTGTANFFYNCIVWPETPKPNTIEVRVIQGSTTIKVEEKAKTSTPGE